MAQGISCTIFEKAPGIGGLWRSNYVSFGVQAPQQLWEFPDFPHRGKRSCCDPCGDCCAQNYLPGAEAQSYIEEYAKFFELESCVVLETEVTSLTRRVDGQRGWTFELKSRGSALPAQNFDYAVIASGMYSAPPNMPSYEGLEAFQGSGGKVIHSSEYLDQAMASGKNVLVIGGCKSAIDISLDTSKVSETTKMLYRSAHWATPRRLIWFIPFQYIFLSRFGQLLVSLFKGGFPGAPCHINCLHRCLACIMRLVFRLDEEIFACQLGQYGDYRPKDDVVKDFYGYAHVLNYDFKKARSAGTITAERGVVVRLEQGGVVMKNPPKTRCCWGDSQSKDPETYAKISESWDEYTIPCDLVVCATGFKKTYAYLPEKERAGLALESDGLYLYRHMFPAAVPDLAFCGSEMATISNTMTFAVQAEYITRVLSGDVVLPSQADMVEEIDIMKTWKRGWMPETSSRASLILLHQTHYHDTLLNDMGIPARRKNCIADMFMPYQPNDYDGIIGSGGKVRVKVAYDSEDSEDEDFSE